MKHSGIERQTLLIMLVPVLVMVVLLKSHDIYTRFGDMDKTLVERSTLLVRQLAASSEYAVFSGNVPLLQREIDSLFIHQDVTGVAVLDQDNTLLAEKIRTASDADMFKRAGPNNRLYQDSDVLLIYEPIVATQIDLDEADAERANVRSAAAAKRLGGVIIQISKLHLNEQKKDVLLFSGIATFLILAVTILVAIWAARRIASPIMEMTRAVGDIGNGALDTRVPYRSGVHELKELAAGINQMAGRVQLDREILEKSIAEATSELRIKKEEAENASRDKSRFLAAASHDLRQPIHALGLFVGQLRGKVNTPEQTRIVAQIEESADAFLDLLSGLLDISKLDAGVVSPQVHAFPIGDLLQRMAHEYEPVARDHDIQLRVRSTRALVLSDPMLLERILHNLLNNALRYTPRHGSVMVACRRRGDSLRIEVRDNGIGIRQDEQKDIFREFFQLANAERDRGKGLGLGLAIVERLSRLLGHEISLRSEPGKGSVFAIDVPLRAGATCQADQAGEHEAEAVPAGSMQEIAPSSLEGARVLLVDDDELVRTSTAGMLRDWGCKVRAVSSLQQVRILPSAQDVDLLVCDYRLPDGTGLEVINWIENACDRHVPAILISGDTAREVLQIVHESGCQLLHKPVRPAKLRSLALYLLAEGNS